MSDEFVLNNCRLALEYLEATAGDDGLRMPVKRVREILAVVDRVTHVEPRVVALSVLEQQCSRGKRGPTASRALPELLMTACLMALAYEAGRREVANV